MQASALFRAICASLTAIAGLIAQERTIGASESTTSLSPQSERHLHLKLDPRVREYVLRNPGKDLPLLLYLTEQPVYSIRREVDARHFLRLQSVQMRLAQAAERKDERAMAVAHEAVREATLLQRRDLFRELEPVTARIQDPIVRRLERRGVRTQHRYTALNMLRVEAPASILDELTDDSEIAEIGLDAELQQHLDVSVLQIGAPYVWNAGYTGTGQSVLVIDSGVAAEHPAFRGRVRSEVFTQNNPVCSAAERNDPRDFNGHGTHVAGIIASAGTAAFPRNAGVAPNATTIYNGKISCENGRTFTDSILRAAVDALKWTDVKVINNSNGGGTSVDDDLLTRRVDELIDLYDLTWVNSAGNNGPATRSLTSPGTAYNLISVASIDTRGTAPRSEAVVASSSSRGPTIGGRRKPDVAAPGVNIRSVSHLNAEFVSMSGTSMAAPHVAGAALLLRQAGVPDRLTLKALLINTTDTSGWNSGFGWGYVNLRRALDQSTWLVRGNLPSVRGASQLILGTMAADRDLFATLVWNRYVRQTGGQFLRNLDTVAYREADQLVLQRSSFSLDNVEQLSVAKRGVATPVVISVTTSNDGNGFTEPFAAAFSEPGFRTARGPALTPSCTGPATTTPGATIRISCEFRNSGEVPAFTSQVQVGFAGPPPAPIELGRIEAGASTTRAFDLTAPIAAGDAQLLVVTSGRAYGLTFSDEASYRITIQTSTPSLAPAITAVVNGASFGASISAGSWVTISGTRLSSTTRTWAAADFAGDRLPTSLDGVRVNINGRSAYVYFVSPTQLNVLAPDDATTGPVSVEVITNTGRSNTINAQKAAVSPALFLFDAGGRRYPAAVHPDGAFLASPGTFPSSVPHRSARPGDTVLIFGSGCGPTTPAAPSDRIVSGALPTVNSVTATIGGLSADVLFAGVVGSGLCQFNVRVPATAQSGDTPLSLVVAGVATQSAFIPVQR